MLLTSTIVLRFLLTRLISWYLTYAHSRPSLLSSPQPCVVALGMRNEIKPSLHETNHARYTSPSGRFLPWDISWLHQCSSQISIIVGQFLELKQLLWSSGMKSHGNITPIDV